MRLPILYQDDDLVAIAKPVGLSTIAAWPDPIPTDVVGLLKAQLGTDYLGVHQRLDRDTSGVLVFARRPEANAWLARAFENRTAVKEYLAVVHGVPPQRAGRIEAPLVEGRDGRMEVVGERRKTEGGRRKAEGGRGSGSQADVGIPPSGYPPAGAHSLGYPGDAVTEYEVLQTAANRRYSLVRLRLLTGRTHQLRVHLGHLGAPVMGDVLYDPQRRPFPRLLLHAYRLTLPTPRGPLTLEAPVPAVFNALLTLPPPTTLSLSLLLALAAERRQPLALDPDVTAYRLVHGAADGVPDIYIDRLGEHLLVSLHSETTELPPRLLAALAEVHPTGSVYVRYRPRQASRLRDDETEQRAPSQPIRGHGDLAWEVVENGLRYLIRSDAGLSVGLFLDMRDMRARVRALSQGKTVLNLFAYTCAFGVAALAGGADRVLNLDLSRRWLDWGMENYRLNGLVPDRYDFVDGDVFDWLRRFARRGQTFDLVILDPPSFATTHGSRFSAERDWPTLAQAAAPVVAPGGRLLACSNHAGQRRRAFRDAVQLGLAQAGCPMTEVGYWSEPALDFPTLPHEEGHLKLFLLQDYS
ncbi:MAG: class I SAM-dependent methyltransferase [Anaerolineae bacterium]|nr:class I SAM-dependent methyltransferase [Anaerolineae bacterium]